MVAIGWIHGVPSKWKPWVSNRVATIQSLTNPEKWKHIAGLENPADLVTRGVSAEKLVSCDLWWHGPEFLRSSEVNCGVPCSEIVLPQNVPEIESERKLVVTEALMICLESPTMFRFERWSTLNRAYRVIAWVLKFIARMRKVEVASFELSVEDLKVSKVVFIKLLQFQYFRKEVTLLKVGRNVPRDSKLSKLFPFLDEEGVMRVRGRIQLSELAFESKHPVILPKCHGSRLLVKFAHMFQNHSGVDAMITFLRNDYEIFGVRLMAKSVKKCCVFCQRVDARACNEPNAPLPKLRVTKAPAFSVTGIDFAGPLFCQDFGEKKFYICLFVCGVIRAVHLELVESLSTADFILAFRRFCALQRVPSVIYSDNGSNFIGGQKILSSYLGPCAPEWKFICPRSPWWGGWWERLVRSVKSALRKTLGKKCLKKVELETVLYEVATSINSRPLTFVGTSVENKLPLSPNHFLTGQCNQGLESRVIEDPENVSVQNLCLRHQEMIERQNDFWKVWSSEYLRNLPASYQKFRKEGNLDVGSVVLIREDNMPRMKWCTGVVEKLHVGVDGVPRSADIHTSSGKKTRAIQRLYNLELSDRSVDFDDSDLSEEKEEEVEEVEVLTGEEVEVDVPETVEKDVNVSEQAEASGGKMTDNVKDADFNVINSSSVSRFGRVRTRTRKLDDYECY